MMENELMYYPTLSWFTTIQVVKIQREESHQRPRLVGSKNFMVILRL